MKEAFTTKGTRLRMNKQAAGFSIVELLVVLAILFALSAVVLWNYRGALTTESAIGGARELNVALRAAQVWANGSKSFPLNAPESDEDRYNRGFGVYLSTSDPTKIIFYGGSSTTSTSYNPANVVRTMALPVGSRIRSICVSDSIDGSNCTLNPVASLRIFYRRPALAPYINYDDVAFSGSAYARIVIASGNSTYDRWVEVFESGRMEISQP